MWTGMKFLQSPVSSEFYRNFKSIANLYQTKKKQKSAAKHSFSSNRKCNTEAKAVLCKCSLHKCKFRPTDQDVFSLVTPKLREASKIFRFTYRGHTVGIKICHFQLIPAPFTTYIISYCETLRRKMRHISRIFL